ncbi:MAG: NAD(P)/FAD-dependent oxidoreductase [Candidatus Aminicenantes bacterium]
MTGFKKNAEVIIIGGGIMGLSTAYNLAEQGCRDVMVLEKDLLAQASTGLSVGGIRQQFSHPANIRLSQESVKVFKNFQQKLGVDIKFQQVGYLFLTQKQNTWQDFLSAFKIQKDLGVPVEILSPEEIKKRWSYLNVAGLKGGTFGPEDGCADPYQAAMGYARASRRLGVHIEEHKEVTAVMVRNGRVEGVKTPAETVSAPVVVNAAGAWGGQVARMAGFDLPVKPYRRQVFMTKAFDAMPRPVPMVVDMDVAFYFRGEEQGILMGMSDPGEPSSFHTHVDRDFMERVVQTAVHRAPVLEQAEILRGWGGLYAVTPDDNPIIGSFPVEGLYCAVGFSGHGFQHGPAVGRVLSDLILKKITPFDLKPFAYDRFGKSPEKGEKRVV